MKPRRKLNYKSLAALSVPAAILVSSAVLNLPMLMRQAMIGIMLVWFYILLFTGFNIWA